MICEKIQEALAELVREAQVATDHAVESDATVAADAAPAAADEAAAAESQRPAIQATDHSARGFHLDVTIAPAQVVAAAAILDRAGFFPEAVTGVDWLADNELEVVYDFNHMDECCRVVIRTRLDRATPEVPTISAIFPGADWHERETHDFFGIIFVGHPNLTPLLLPEDADFHPLLKDFAK